jgi:predicted DNA-binding transcriptional regulator AlpA
MQAATAPPLSPMLHRNAVLGLLGISPSTLKRMVKLGTFPAPLALAPRIRLWVRSEVLAHIAGKLADRDPAPSPADRGVSGWPSERCNNARN